MRNDLLAKLEHHKDLPVLPEIMFQLERLLSDPDADLTKVAKLIESDQVLSGKLLKVANSAFFRAGNNEIKTVSMAVVHIGLNQIRDIALSLNLTKLFHNNTVIDHRKFWKHSLGVGLASKLLSEYRGLPEDACELAFLAGLMHDIGVMVFCTLVPDEYEDILKKNAESDMTIEYLENERFGIDHAELGAAFIEKNWDMDGNIVVAVRQHHAPFSGTKMQNFSSQVVNIADGLCSYFGIESGLDNTEQIFNTGAYESLGLELSDADKIMDQVRMSLEEAEAMLE